MSSNEENTIKHMIELVASRGRYYRNFSLFISAPSPFITLNS